MGGGRWVRVWLQGALKLVNSVIGLVGMGLILYSLWLIRHWYKDGLQTSASPWFINWEEDFPDDPSGRFNELKDFVRSNFEMCKWIGLSFAAAEAIALFIALVLRVLGPDREINYDSDDDYVPARLPLLRNQAQQTSNIIDPSVLLKNESLKGVKIS